MAQNHETSKEIENKVNEDTALIDVAHELDEKKDLNKINSIKSNGNDESAKYTKCGDESPTERVKFFGIDHDDSFCSEDSSEDDTPPPPIPDGGWGWVVVVSAFLVSACADGLAFSFGLLHEEFTDFFETTQSKTSLIGSLFLATPLLAGPIMSALVDRYGCRIMTMIAGILSAAAFLLAAVSNSVEMLCLTLGFLSGLAMGIFYVTAVVSVAFWFDKRRNLAVSLASCGIGFGTLIYSPMTNYFLEIYDWRNTLVLLAGTLLNMCVCGALMRNPEWVNIKMKRQKILRSKSGRSSSNASIGSSVGGDSVFLGADELKALMKSGKSPEYILSMLATSIAEAEQLEATTQMNAEQTFKRNMHSAIHLPTFIQHNEKVPAEVLEKLMRNKRLYNVILQNYPDILTRRRSEVNVALKQPTEGLIEPAQLPVAVKVKKPRTESESKKSKEKINEENKTNDNKVESNAALTESNIKMVQNKLKQKPLASHNVQPNNWLSRQISTDHHYLRNMHIYRNTLMHRGAMLNIPRYKLRASSLPEVYKNSMWSLDSESDDERKWYHHFYETMKSTFDFRMYTEFHFLMFNLSNLIMSVWFIVPYYFLKSYMTASGVEGGALMISIIGVASSIGIVLLGWAGDQPWVNVTKTYAVCLTICGLSVAAYPLFITNYWAVAVISTIFGLSFASSYSYTPAILMELMPIDRFTVAYGMMLLTMGVGHLAGPPIGGLLFDMTARWDLTFYVGGLWLVISGVCVGVIPFTENLRMCGSAPLLKEAEEKSESDAEV